MHQAIALLKQVAHLLTQRQLNAKSRDTMRFKSIIIILFYFISSISAMALEVHPSSVLHSDVNTRSFIVAWSAPAESRGTVNVYLDPKGTHPVFSTTREAQFTYTDDKAIKNKMTAMGLFRTRVKGLSENTYYYYQIRQEDSNGNVKLVPESGALFSVKTMAKEGVVLNDTVAAYIEDKTADNAVGNLVYFYFPNAKYPLSHIVGDSLPDNMAAVSLSNLSDGETHISQLSTNVNIIGHSVRGLDNNQVKLADNSQSGRLQILASIISVNDNKDTDGDGIPDWYEKVNGLNINVDDSLDDLDNDGLSNIEEFQLGTSSSVGDTDGDGISDYQEVKVTGTSATNSDSDNDGLSDYQELTVYKTDALATDTDGDGFSDSDEIKGGFDPKDDKVHPPYADADKDGIADKDDNCPALPNPSQINTDDDEQGDACDDDDDNDGIKDYNDNAPLVPNSGQEDSDGDSVGDVIDNCPLVSNEDQKDNDTDGLGDLCDDDDDNDTVLDYQQLGEPSNQALLLQRLYKVESVNLEYSKSQSSKLYFVKQSIDSNQQVLLGEFDLSLHRYTEFELTEESKKMIGQLITTIDPYNCECVVVNQPNSQLKLTTEDGVSYIRIPSHTPERGAVQFASSNDGSAYKSYSAQDHASLMNLLLSGSAFVSLDNCQFVPNKDQSDVDEDGRGDACDISTQDLDGDGVSNANDNCPLIHNESQENIDGDEFGDACDEDIDGDGLTNDVEINELYTDPRNAYSWSNSVSDGDADFDNDGFSNQQESTQGTGLLVPNIKLVKGRNYTYYPTELLDLPRASELVRRLGGSAKVQGVSTLGIDGEVTAEYTYDGESWVGDDFTLELMQAVIIDAVESNIIPITESSSCSSIALQFGINFTALPCIRNGQSAFGLLEKYGEGKLDSITGVNSDTGLYQTAKFVNGELSGTDFPLLATQGFKLQVTSPFTLKFPPRSEHGVTLTNIEDIRIVSSSKIDIFGFIDTQSGVLLINGEAVQIRDGSFRLNDFKLTEGENSIVLKGRDANGGTIYLEFSVKYAKPPLFDITSQTDGQLLYAKSVTVAGKQEGAERIVVNGVEGVLNGDLFTVFPVPLSAGENKLKIVAYGKFGVTAEKTINLRAEPRLLTLPAGSVEEIELFQSFKVSNKWLITLPEYITVDFDGKQVFASKASRDNAYPKLSTYGFKASITDNDPSMNPSLGIKFESIGSDPTYGVYQFSVPMTLKNAFIKANYTEEAWIQLTLVKPNGGAAMVVTSHQDGEVESSPNTRYQGYVIAAETLKYQGKNIDIQEGFFDIPINLEPGRNYLEFELSRNGVLSTEIYRLDYYPDEYPQIKVFSHSHDQHVSSNNIVLSGSVSEPNALLSVNGRTVALEDGRFSVDIPITEEENWITINAEYEGRVSVYKLKVNKRTYTAKYSNLLDREIIHTAWPSIKVSTSSGLKRARFNNGSWVEAIDENSVQFDFTFESGLKEGKNTVLTELEFKDGSIQKLTRVLRYEKYAFDLKVLTPDTIRLPLKIDEALYSKAKRFRFALGWTRSLESGLFQAPTPASKGTTNGAYGRIDEGTIVDDLGVDELGQRTIILEFPYEIYQILVTRGELVDDASTIRVFDDAGEQIYYQSIHYLSEFIEINEEPKIILWSHRDNGIVRSTSTSVLASVVNFIPEKATLNGKPLKIKRQVLNNDVNEYFLMGGRVDSLLGNYEIMVSNASGAQVGKRFSLNFEPYKYTLVAGQNLYSYPRDEIITFNEPEYVFSRDRVERNHSEINMKSLVQMDSNQSNIDGIYIGKVIVGLKTNEGGATTGKKRVNHYVNLPDNRSPITNSRNYLSYVDVLGTSDSVPDITLKEPMDGGETYFSVVRVKVDTNNDKLADVYINGLPAKKYFIGEGGYVSVISDFDSYHYLDLPLELGDNEVKITAHSTLNDNVSEKTVVFKRKAMPKPAFEIGTPRQNELFKVFNEGAKPVTIDGIIDVSIPVNKVLVDGVEVTLRKDGNFLYTSEYRVGDHQIVVEAINDAGSTQKVVNFSVAFGSPTLKLDSPNEAELNTMSEKILIHGSVDDKNAQLTINGTPISVDSQVGDFELEYYLNQGENMIQIVATNKFGESKKLLVVNRVVADESHLEVRIDDPAQKEWQLKTTSDVISQLNRYRTSFMGPLPHGIQVNFTYKKLLGSPADTIVFDYHVYVGQSTRPGMYTIPVAIDLLDTSGNTVHTHFLNIFLYVGIARLQVSFDNLRQEQKIGTNEFQVRGKVNDPEATLDINEQSVVLTEHGDFSHTLLLSEGINQIVVRASTAEQHVNKTIIVSVDTDELILNIQSPTEQEGYSQSEVLFKGSISDPLASVIIQGHQATVDAQGEFYKRIKFAEGKHQVFIDATNGYKSVRKSVSFEVLPQPLSFEIFSPVEGAEFDKGEVTINGQVSHADAKVTVDGKLADVDSIGAFSVTLNLDSGEHRLQIKAERNGKLVEKYLMLKVRASSQSEYIELIQGGVSEVITYEVPLTSEQRALVRRYSYSLSLRPYGTNFQILRVYGTRSGIGFDYQYSASQNAAIDRYPIELTLTLKDSSNATISSEIVDLILVVQDDNPEQLDLEIISPEPNSIINSNSVTIMGRVNQVDALVRVNNENTDIQNDGTFTKRLELSDGQHQIMIVAEFEGQHQSKIIPISVDGSTPRVIVNVAAGQSVPVTVNVSASQNVMSQVRNLFSQFSNMPAGVKIDTTGASFVDSETIRMSYNLTTQNQISGAEINVVITLKDGADNALLDYPVIFEVNPR
ncbi:thrombospondin type 3 repeat-containing protein [Pseudoalteromonas piscicida]|uniref:thrombospondin type 3 repeat-containing protein n=1 Tax=Pseudoalteromonas piscicida TaxID=43662 RepID=UPI0032C1405A